MKGREQRMHGQSRNELLGLYLLEILSTEGTIRCMRESVEYVLRTRGVGHE